MRNNVWLFSITPSFLYCIDSAGYNQASGKGPWHASGGTKILYVVMGSKV